MSEQKVLETGKDKLGTVFVIIFAVVFGVCASVFRNDPIFMAEVSIAPFLFSCICLAWAPNSKNAFIRVMKVLGDISAASLSLATLLAVPGCHGEAYTIFAWVIFLVLCFLIAGRTWRSL